MDTIEPTGLSGEDTPAAASALVAACEQAWASIQDRHPEVPNAVIILGTGVERGRLVKLGHWWAGRWIADGQPRGEVLLAGEALHLPAEAVFEVLLHEAAHGLNAARHIKDTSRGGRYHNRRFQQTAEALGLTVAKLGPYGWADTGLAAPTAREYATEIETIAAAMRIARTLTRPATTLDGAGHDDQQSPGQGTSGASSGPARCGCGRRMRMAPSVLARGPVICGLCNEPFTTEPREPARTADRPTHQLDTQDAWRDRARQTIDRALDHDRQQFAQVTAWYGQRRAGYDPTLTPRHPGDREALDELARALLVLDGTLRAPTIAVEGREFAVGESIYIDAYPADALDRHASPTTGTYGTITEIDPIRQRLVVDVPTTGTYHLNAATPVAQALRHAYTEPTPARDTMPTDAHSREIDVGCEV